MGDGGYAKYLVIRGELDEEGDEMPQAFEVEADTIEEALSAFASVRFPAWSENGAYREIDVWEDGIGWQPHTAEHASVRSCGRFARRSKEWFALAVEAEGRFSRTVYCPSIDDLFDAALEAAESGLCFESEEDVPDGFAAWPAKGRYVGVAPAWGQGPNHLSAPPVVRENMGMSRCLQALVDLAGTASVSDMKARLESLGVYLGRNNANVALVHLAGAGRIRRVSRGLYSRVS